MNSKSARTLFVAALALYILWFGALVALAIVSADRPADANAGSSARDRAGRLAPSERRLNGSISPDSSRDALLGRSKQATSVRSWW